MSVCCECRVLSGRVLCDELITRPEVSYRLRCVTETSWMRRPWRAGGWWAKNKQTNSWLHFCAIPIQGFFIKLYEHVWVPLKSTPYQRGRTVISASTYHISEKKIFMEFWQRIINSVKIGSLKVMLHLEASMNICPYLLHLLSDIG